MHAKQNPYTRMMLLHRQTLTGTSRLSTGNRSRSVVTPWRILFWTLALLINLAMAYALWPALLPCPPLFLPFPFLFLSFPLSSSSSRFLPAPLLRAPLLSPLPRCPLSSSTFAYTRPTDQYRQQYHHHLHHHHHRRRRRREQAGRCLGAPPPPQGAPARAHARVV